MFENFNADNLVLSEDFVLERNWDAGTWLDSYFDAGPGNARSLKIKTVALICCAIRGRRFGL